jgi:hypothetical protein
MAVKCGQNSARVGPRGVCRASIGHSRGAPPATAGGPGRPARGCGCWCRQRPRRCPRASWRCVGHGCPGWRPAAGGARTRPALATCGARWRPPPGTRALDHDRQGIFHPTPRRPWRGASPAAGPGADVECRATSRPSRAGAWGRQRPAVPPPTPGATASSPRQPARDHPWRHPHRRPDHLTRSLNHNRVLSVC